jgi:hypothetical protein
MTDLTLLKQRALEAIERPYPGTEAYAAMRAAQEAFAALMTPSLFLSLLADMEALKGEKTASETVRNLLSESLERRTRALEAAEARATALEERVRRLEGASQSQPCGVGPSDLTAGLGAEPSAALTPDEQRHLSWWLSTDYGPNIEGVSMSRDLLRRIVAGYEAESKEAGEIAERDGYERAVQDIDILTGGDGEFVASTFPGEGCPDVAAMKARIVERFAALSNLTASTAGGGSSCTNLGYDAPRGASESGCQSEGEP